ncbi:MAG: DNA-binding protein [Enterococcus faecium]|uniref:DNA-binding protein n=1 Tax=Enterococcus mundtii TaxID=53346 RepID=A0A2T5DAX7_ENTMU|nr:DNA-binding protein [Enterococcus mundtii]MBE6173204.1 DNA-binding protein [Enterococcus faecium]PTO34787.1 DNA-binding protein [Enterococcus mundtii]
MKSLTESKVDRQNILNNTLAIEQISKEYSFNGVDFEGKTYFINTQISEFFDVDIRTIERLLEDNREELESNDYEVFVGKRLSDFRTIAMENSATDINVGSKTRQLGVSTFKTVLNFAMLLKTSDKAREVRSKILDIVIDVMAQKTGGSTKYINQRDANYLTQAFVEETERKKFTNALDLYVDMPSFKYGYFTNCVYKSIFKENAKEYREILNLSIKDKVRNTMYSEVLLVIASFEAGIAYEIELEYNKAKKKLSKKDVDNIIKRFSEHPAQKPHIDEARTKMATRDFGLRDAYHEKLEEYLQPVTPEDYEKFLGEKSKSLSEQLEEHKEIFERLKDR